MKFGICPRGWGDYLEDAVSVVTLAQSLGYSSFFVEEHHNNADYTSSPLIIAASLSQIVRKMDVGTAVAIIPLYNSIRFAEDVATLAQSTKTNLLLGVSLGYRRADFDAFCVPFDERSDRMEEGLSTILRILKDVDVSSSGRFNSVHEFTLQPRIADKKRIRIWVGGWEQTEMRRAAKFADSWFAGPMALYSRVQDCLGDYKNELKYSNRSFEGFPLMRDVFLAKDRDSAYLECRKAFEYRYQQDHKTYNPSDESQFEMWFHEDRFVIGTPSDAIEQISKYEQDGCVHLVMRAAMPFLSNDKVLESIRLFGETVIPYFNTER